MFDEQTSPPTIKFIVDFSQGLTDEDLFNEHLPVDPRFLRFRNTVACSEDYLKGFRFTTMANFNTFWLSTQRGRPIVNGLKMVNSSRGFPPVLEIENAEWAHPKS